MWPPDERSRPARNGPAKTSLDNDKPKYARRAAGTPAVRCSREVVEHHAKQHQCPAGPTEPAAHQVCECGRTVLLVCDHCAAPMFCVVDPTVPLCAHAEKLMARFPA